LFVALVSLGFGWRESIAGARPQRHKEWRDGPCEPPYAALYGAKKLAKTKLTGADFSC